MDLWVDRSHTITLRPPLSGQLGAQDDFQKTHTIYTHIRERTSADEG